MKSVISPPQPLHRLEHRFGIPRKIISRHGFALAWQVRPKLVLRAGAGIFYDLGYSDITNVMISFPYIQEKPLILNTSFPLDPNVAKPPAFTTNRPVAVMSVVDPNHVLP